MFKYLIVTVLIETLVIYILDKTFIIKFSYILAIWVIIGFLDQEICSKLNTNENIAKFIKSLEIATFISPLVYIIVSSLL